MTGPERVSPTERPAPAVRFRPRRARRASLALTLAAGGLLACASLRTPPLEPPGVSEIVELSQAGTPPEELAQRIRESGAVYRLRASELLALHGQGVPLEVLDAMQESWLNAVRREQELEDWRRWDDFDGWGRWPGPYLQPLLPRPAPSPTD